MLLQPASCAWTRVCSLMLLSLVVSTAAAPLAWTYRAGNYSWAVAVSSDGRYAIAGSDDMRIYFFDARSRGGVPLWSYTARGYVRHVAISGNGTYAAAGDTDGNLIFFRSAASGNPIWSRRFDSPIDGLAMSVDGDYLVAGDRQGTIDLFKTDPADPANQRYRVPGGVLALSISRSRVFAATASRGGVYFFGDTPSRSGHAWVFQNHTSFPQIAISENASYIVAGASDGYVYLLNRSGQLIDREKLGGSISALSLSGMTSRVVAGSTNGVAFLYAIQDSLSSYGSLVAQRPITSACISENGQRVSIAYLDGAVSMFDKSLSTELWMFSTGAIVHSLSMSSTGLVMAASSDNGNVYLFNEEEQKSTNEPALRTLAAPAVVAGFAVLYLVWRRKRKSAAGKPYDRRRASQSREIS